MLISFLCCKNARITFIATVSHSWMTHPAATGANSSWCQADLFTGHWYDYFYSRHGLQIGPHLHTASRGGRKLNNKRSRMTAAEVAFYPLKTNAHSNGTSADIKLRRSRRVTQTSACKQRAGSLGGYSLSARQKKTFADDSENRWRGKTRGNEAAWHCFPFCVQIDEHVRPPCVNSMSARGYDMSSDRDSMLLGCVTFLWFTSHFSHKKSCTVLF